MDIGDKFLHKFLKMHIAGKFIQPKFCPLKAKPQMKLAEIEMLGFAQCNSHSFIASVGFCGGIS